MEEIVEELSAFIQKSILSSLDSSSGIGHTLDNLKGDNDQALPPCTDQEEVLQKPMRQSRL